MTLLSPFALLWLGSVPVLVWLWRLASTQRQTHIPSLVPFEHLLTRPPRRRRHLYVNLLFWLQLAALMLLAVALAQPVVFHQRAKTTLVIVDTSASMGAHMKGPTALERGKHLLRARLRRKARADQWLVVASAPVTTLTPQPSSDSVQLGAAIDALQVNDVGGTLATAAHIGHALLGGRVDETLVVTDEPRPALAPSDRVEFLTVGEALPNVAMVGVEAQGPLCSDVPPRILVTVQNFSNESVNVRLVADQRGHRVTETSALLAARARVNIPLAMPKSTDGWVGVNLAVPHDALAMDNHAEVMVRSTTAFPVAVVSDTPDFRRVIGHWLSACQGLAWTDGSTPVSLSSPHLVVTDLPGTPTSSGQHQTPSGARQGGREPLSSNVVGVLQFLGHTPSSSAVLAHWTATGDHPIASYLPAVSLVAASLGTALQPFATGEPVVWGILEGRRIPIVLAGEHEGHRTVSFFVEPTPSPDSTPLLILFLNSLRWLMGQADLAMTGEPLFVPSLDAGTVVVHRPDGLVERSAHEGGVLRYDTTTRAGFYRFTSGRQDVTRAVNFFDPRESDLMQRTSTWQPMPSGAQPSARERRAPWPLTNLLTVLILLVVLIETRLYCRKNA